MQAIGRGRAIYVNRSLRGLGQVNVNLTTDPLLTGQALSINTGTAVVTTQAACASANGTWRVRKVRNSAGAIVDDPTGKGYCTGLTITKQVFTQATCEAAGFTWDATNRLCKGAGAIDLTSSCGTSPSWALGETQVADAAGNCSWEWYLPKVAYAVIAGGILLMTMLKKHRR